MKLQCGTILWLLGIFRVGVAINQIDFSDGFDCASSGIQLNGDRPFPRMVTNGLNSKCTIELTSDKAEPRAVSVFSALDFNSDNLWFQSRFRYRIYGDLAGSADGIAFVVHQDPRGPSALGGSGGNLGVYGSSSTIIKPALVVELDTYKNGLGQIPSDTKLDAVHVTFIDKNGNVFEIAETEYETLRTGQSEYNEVMIIHQDGQLTVSIDNTPVLNVCMNLTDPTLGAGPNFSGDLVIAGFTAATGVEGDIQNLLLWQFQEIGTTTSSVISSPCPVRVRETLAPTPPPTPPPPTKSPVRRPTPAPTPAPLRRARVQVVLNGNQNLSETSLLALEASCGALLTNLDLTNLDLTNLDLINLDLINLDALPTTTCRVENQMVVDSTVVLRILVEADVPGLDIQVFANIVILALNSSIFTEPFDAIGTGLPAPAFTTFVTIEFESVRVDLLTDEGRNELEATCRELLTIRLGNPNIRCKVFRVIIGGITMTMGATRQRQLQGPSSSTEVDMEITGGNPVEGTQTEMEFQNSVPDALGDNGLPGAKSVTLFTTFLSMPEFLRRLLQIIARIFRRVP